MDVSYSLYIKYGLKDYPTNKQIQDWLKLADQLIASGYTRERAGEEAARKIFPDYNGMFYASEADTIEALLAAARRRD